MIEYCLQDLLEVFKHTDANEISYEKVSRKIYSAFKTLKLRNRGLHKFGEQPLLSINGERLAQLQSDEAFLQSEVERYLKHYEEIKHLI